MGLFSGITKAIGKVVGGVSKAASGVLGAVSPYAPLIGAGLSYLGQKEANATNVDLASMNNETAINLADTSYQRRVKDLMAAGLNPMLAYTQGGAQVPQLSTAHVENTAKSANEGGLAAMQSALIRSQIDTQESQASLNSANAAKSMAETKQVEAQTGLTGSQTKFTDLQVKNFYAGVDKILSETNLNRMQENLVEENVANAVATRSNIKAHTGNLAADTALKKISALAAQQGIDLRSFEFPEKSAFANFYKTNFGKDMAPFLHSAKGVNLLDIPKAEFFKSYHSR